MCTACTKSNLRPLHTLKIPYNYIIHHSMWYISLLKTRPNGRWNKTTQMTQTSSIKIKFIYISILTRSLSCSHFFRHPPLKAQVTIVQWFSHSLIQWTQTWFRAIFQLCSQITNEWNRKCSTMTEIRYSEHNRVFSFSQNVVKTIQSLAKNFLSVAPSNIGLF